MFHLLITTFLDQLKIPQLQSNIQLLLLKLLAPFIQVIVTKSMGCQTLDKIIDLQVLNIMKNIKKHLVKTKMSLKKLMENLHILAIL